MTVYSELARNAAEELRVAAAGVDPGQLNDLIEEIADAEKVVVAGVGREGLMMRAPRHASLPHGAWMHMSLAT